MFRRLKLKLTLINVGVIMIVIALLMSGIYLLMSMAIAEQSREQLRTIAKSAGSGEITPKHRSGKYSAKDFYAKLNNAGIIQEYSPNLPLPKGQLDLLVQEALQNPESAVLSVQESNEEYRFLITPLAGRQGSIIVFLGTTEEKLYLGHLIIAFLITGMAGVALTLYCSLFMANRALVPIQQSWDRQKHFVADASHELRTPLTVIQTNLDIVLDNPTELIANQMLWLENIKLESQRMSKLINDLLFLARTDSPQGLLAMESFSVDQALREVLVPFEPVAAQGGLTLNYTLEDICLMGDRTRIKQLAAIFLDNAIKYTPPGGNIILELKKSNKRVLLVITDTGEGIAQEHLNKIFQRFYRIDTARSRESGGTGLGLSIAEWIVKAHKGKLQVSSTPGQGTSITVSFPM